MPIRARLRNELAAALERGEGPATRGGRANAMYVGNIKLASAKGHLTKAGYAWIKMGGVDPVRYSGALIVDGESKYVMDRGRRVDLLRRLPTVLCGARPRRAFCAFGSTTNGRS